jgi:hypothetical protein
LSCSASFLKAGSLVMSLKACRSAATRSAGTCGPT